MASFLNDLYASHREEIIEGTGIILFILAFAVPYLVWDWIPVAFRSLFGFIFVTSFVAFALVTWSFMKTTVWTVYLVASVKGPHDPTQWVDFRIFYEKYRKYILFGAGANALYFIILTVYLLTLGNQMSQALSSETTSVSIFLSWLILNCAWLIGSCLDLYMSDPSPN